MRDTADEVKMGKRYYTFARYQNDEELPGGNIKPAQRTGMIKTGFRPSDSPNELPYNVPGNAMLARYLKAVEEDILSKVPSTSVLYQAVISLQVEMYGWHHTINEAVLKYGTV